MNALAYLLVILILLLLIVAFVLTFSVPISRTDYQPLLTTDGYLVINPLTRKIELSSNVGTSWQISRKYGFISGYTTDLGVLCMSTINDVSGQICSTDNTSQFYIQGNTIRSNGSCIVNNNGAINLGNCSDALLLV